MFLIYNSLSEELGIYFSFVHLFCIFYNLYSLLYHIFSTKEKFTNVTRENFENSTSSHASFLHFYGTVSFIFPTF